MQPQFKDAIQFVTGRLTGLIAQVMGVEPGGKVLCFHRDLDGAPNFFTVTDETSFRLIGSAVIGPKPNDSGQSAVTAAAASPTPVPPPLNPQELLEPLPADVKAKPMTDAAITDADVPPARPLPPLVTNIKAKKSAAELSARIKALPKITYTATVRNGLGDEAKVTIHGREGLSTNRYIGIAVLKAIKVIPQHQPMTVTDWSRNAQAHRPEN